MNVGNRCVSGCQGLSEEICSKSPRCSYVNSKKKYCRLSHQYKMVTPRCTVRKRITNKNRKDIADKVVKRYLRKTPKNRHFAKHNQPVDEQLSQGAMDEIKNMMVKTPLKKHVSPNKKFFNDLQNSFNTKSLNPLVSRYSPVGSEDLDNLMNQNTTVTPSTAELQRASPDRGEDIDRLIQQKDSSLQNASPDGEADVLKLLPSRDLSDELTTLMVRQSRARVRDGPNTRRLRAPPPKRK